MRHMVIMALAVLLSPAVTMAQPPLSVGNLICDDSTPGEVSMTWDLSVATYSSIEIWVNGIPEATLSGTDTSYLFIPPAGLTVPYDLCVAGVTPTLLAIACCTVTLFPWPSDDCVLAGAIITGQSVDYDTIIATTDGPDLAPFCDPGPIADDQIHDDLWFCWTARYSGPHEVDVDNFAQPVRIGVYFGCDCPADPATIDACGEVPAFGAGSVSFTATAGQSYLIRVGAAIPGTPTIGLFEVTCNCPTPELFRRGDGNIDGAFDISDPVSALAALFIGTPASLCADSTDSNDDGIFDISDPVYALAALFMPGSPGPPAPGSTDCGADPTDDALDCAGYDACP